MHGWHLYAAHDQRIDFDVRLGEQLPAGVQTQRGARRGAGGDVQLQRVSPNTTACASRQLCD